MKTFKVIAIIHSFYALATARILTSGNGASRHITHRLLLNPSKSLAIAIAECAQHETAQGNPASFCLTRQDGLLALDLDQNQLGMLTRGGYRIDQLVKVAKGATFNANVDLRLEGDEIPNVRSGEMIEITSNHAVLNTPEITISENVAQRLRIEDSVASQIASAMMSGVAQPASVPSTKEVPEEIPSDDEPATAVPAEKPARKADARKATASTVKVK